MKWNPLGLLLFGTAFVGCCIDGGYTYRLRGRVVDASTGDAGARTVQLRTFPPRDEPTVPFRTDPDGNFDLEAYSAMMWGTCCPVPLLWQWQIPVAPASREVSVYAEGDPEGWRVVPTDTVRQECTRKGCLIDFGTVDVASPVSGNGKR